MQTVFWLSIGLVLYSYLLYPALMLVVGRASTPPPSNPEQWASVALVVAAYNEERHIDLRIQNFLKLDYEPELLKLYVGSDGSSDRTVELATAHESPRIRVFPFAERRGKSSVLNDLLAAVNEEIVVFTDANTHFDASAVRALVRHFSDPEVGAVSGELILGEPQQGDNRDGSYWRLETLIKKGESRIGGLLGANGGIYAIRREYYQSLPPDTIVDDFTVVMNISSAGHRTVFAPEAIAFEEVPEGIDAEFRRRIRIGIGNYQAFFRYPEYWLRTSWLRRFTYFSHKILRWFTPHLLVIALLVSLLLSGQSPFGIFLVSQVLGYTLLGLGLLMRTRIALPSLFAIPLFVFALNVAFLTGFWRYLSGNYSGQWRRTERV
jgi:cellulose synthase/poly-beta-1,6-N-acetylglucosamine synthase-like glycosyltransferase